MTTELPSVTLLAVWDLVPVGVIALDATGRVIYANAMVADICRIAPAEVAGVFEGRSSRLLDGQGHARPLHRFPIFAAVAPNGSERGAPAQVAHPHRAPVQLWIEVLPLADGQRPLDRLFIALVSGRERDVSTAGKAASERSEIMSALSRELARTALTKTEIVDRLAEELASRLGELSVVALLDEDGQSLRIASAAHPEFEVAQFFHELERAGTGHAGRGLFGRVVAGGEPLVLGDVRPADLLENVSPERRTGLRRPPALRGAVEERFQALLVPIAHRSESLGAIAVLRRSSDPYGKVDVQWLTEVAELIGLALVNARLQEEAAGRLVVLEAARRVDLAIAASVDTRLVLDIMVDQLLVHMGVSGAAILVPRDDDGQFDILASAGLHTNGPQRRELRANDPYHSRAMVTSTPQDIPRGEIEGWMRWIGLTAEPFAAAQVSPLLARGEPVGLLELFWRGERRPDAEQRLGIESLSLRAGLTIRAMRDDERRSRAELSQIGHERLPAIEDLSRAQLAVLRFLAQGDSNREIARQLYVSENTVKSHLREIFRKLGTRSRLQAAMVGAAWLESLAQARLETRGGPQHATQNIHPNQ